MQPIGKHLGLILSVSLTLMLAVCAQDQVPVQVVPFTTIERGPGLPLKHRQPGLFVLTTSAEGDALFGQWPEEPITRRLPNLDYMQVFAIVVEQGQQGSTCSSVRFEQVTRVGDQVGVHVMFRKPHSPAPGEPELLCNGVVTYPYELITVRKDATWSRSIRFGLVVGGKTIATTTHAIP